VHTIQRTGKSGAFLVLSLLLTAALFFNLKKYFIDYYQYLGDTVNEKLIGFVIPH